MSWKVDYQWQPDRQTFQLFIRQIAGPGKCALVTKLEMEYIETVPGQLLQDLPILEMDRESAEDFMRAFANAAWKMGIKPTEFRDDNKELLAVKYHLGDIREVAGLKKND